MLQRSVTARPRLVQHRQIFGDDPAEYRCGKCRSERVPEQSTQAAPGLVRRKFLTWLIHVFDKSLYDDVCLALAKPANASLICAALYVLSVFFSSSGSCTDGAGSCGSKILRQCRQLVSLVGVGETRVRDLAHLVLRRHRLDTDQPLAVVEADQAHALSIPPHD